MVYFYMKQHNIYNLNEKEEEDELTHGGVPLSQLKSLNTEIDDEDEIGEDGLLDCE